MADWISYWDTHPLYVNARHRDVHARLVGDGILAFVVSPRADVLDYGSGEALYAERVATSVGSLALCEAGEKLRKSLAARVAGNAKISVLTPAEAEALADRSLDLVVMNSVAQYLTPEETGTLLRLFRRLLRPDGRLVIGDVVPLRDSPLTDALALLRLALREGFLLAAVFGLLRTLLSGYWRLRQHMGLTRYSEAGMRAKLEAAGFSAQRMTRNIGHNPVRMTFLARPA
jgi:SAM-dependent methyltransferase